MAVQRMKNTRTAGLGGIPAEMLKAVGETTVIVLNSIVDHIWETGEWTENWVQSELIALLKITGTQNCEKRRTINLISHAAKLSYVGCHNTLYKKLQKNSLDSSTVDEQLMRFSHRETSLTSKTTEGQDEQIWIMFVDYANAFENVDYNMLWKTLIERGVPQHLVWSVETLYSGSTDAKRVDGTHTNSF